jgi:hypothetical protein
MDANKLETLRGIGYKIRRTCGNCAFGRFVEGSDFGLCMIQRYQHLKHTEGDRNLSVNKYGVCPKYTAGLPAATLGPWREFFDE